MNRPDNRATPSRRYSVFEKILNYTADTSMKTACNRPNVRATPSGCGP